MPSGILNYSKKRAMTRPSRARILNILFNSEVQLTAQAYIGKIAHECGISQRDAKMILTGLVNDQTLAYQELYGGTYVMESFSKPVRITDRFVISPPGVTAPHSESQDLTITILPGISFGSGHHPTTRLCMSALDRIFFKDPGLGGLTRKEAGDIGTGSAILALAACKAGMQTCQAWEIDANAVSEARQNVAVNGLTERIPVIDGMMSPDDLQLGLIMANLRFPTLKKVAPLIKAALCPQAYIVLSGIRSWECDALIQYYANFNCYPVWKNTKKNWSVVTLRYMGKTQTKSPL